MNVIVGGSGFVGSRLCARLSDHGRPFVVVDKAPSRVFPDRWVVADVRDIDSLRKAIPDRADALVNLAAEHKDNVRPLSLYEDVNVGGARNVCAVAVEKDINKIVFTSSVACYGFARANTDERGEIAPFNEYGRTKFAAEEVYRTWQAAEAANRCLVIVRPTVIFGEKNRGNVYNLLKQVMGKRFVMVGSGRNVKSMAYVENAAAFLEHALSFGPGVHLYNYIDKPDLSVGELVALIRSKRGRVAADGVRLPHVLGHMIGAGFDLVSKVTGREFPVSAIRVKKFCATTQFATSVAKAGFVPPVSLREGLERTIRHEFLDGGSNHDDVYYSE